MNTSPHQPERIPGGGIDLSHLTGNAPGAASPSKHPDRAGGPGGQIVQMPSLVTEVQDANFDQAAQFSSIVPIILELYSHSVQASKDLSNLLERVVHEHDGHILLMRAEIDTNPAVAQACNAHSAPTVLAILAGNLVPLFQGSVTEPQLRDICTQLVQLATQHGVNGRVVTPEKDDTKGEEEPHSAPIPDAHLAALEATERGDYRAAVSEWEAVLAKTPSDTQARAALVQVKLLARLSSRTADEIRSLAAAEPDNIDAQFAVSDLDVSGGHVEDAFLRLLDLFAARENNEDRSTIRERLLELFEVVGVADPRVIAARGRLANLLY